MKNLLLYAAAWLWCSPLLFAAHTFQIPHLAGNGWKTVVTAYNESDQAATARFVQWNDAGARIREIESTVPAHGQHTWAEHDFLPEGIAVVVAEEERVRVRLSYQYGDGPSACELFLPPDNLGTRWLIANSRGNTFSWFGVAVANFGDRTVTVTATAYKDGVEKGRAAYSLEPGRKWAALSADLWGLDCGEVDAVLVASDEPISAPISVSGKADPSRYVLSSGCRIESPLGERRFYVPHIAGGSWKTDIIIHNGGPEPGTFSVHQYDDAGNEVNTIAQKVAPFGSARLSTWDGTLSASGSALLTGRGSLSVRLSYRYAESESVCEFLLDGEVSRLWLLPNSIQTWPDWSGIAFQNPNPAPMGALLRAYKDGREVRSAAITVAARQKWAALLQQALNLSPRDFDQVTIETSQPVPMPLAITGDDAQDRYLFSGGQALASSPGLKKWTYLFYSDAEFANGYNPTRDFALEAYSGPNLDVLVLEDTMATPTTLYYVEGRGSLRTLGTPAERDMGHVRTLYEFIMKAKTEYPADRYILAFYDHGSGWQGCCMDQTDGNLGLTMDEIKSAVSTAGGVDLVLFTAPCLMGQLESVYQLRDWADVYVGSENVSGYLGWFGTIDFIRSAIETDPEICSAELGREIVDSIARNIPVNESRFRYSYASTYTMSAVDVRAIRAVAEDVDALARVFIGGRVNDQWVSAITGQVQNYSAFYSVDLYDFLDKYKTLETDPAVLLRIEKVQESLNRCILAEYHGSGNPGSHGLAIYLPLPSYVSYQSSYGDPQYGLDFAADTSWDEFIRSQKAGWR